MTKDHHERGSLLDEGLDFDISGVQNALVDGVYSTNNWTSVSMTLCQDSYVRNVEMVDGMISDGLWDVYNQVHMGLCAEDCAARHGISRSAQDVFALEATRRAIEAQKKGLFQAEIVPVEIEGKKGEKTVVAEDEGPKTAKPDKIPPLKPVFKKDGTVTAANASSINDGGAAVVLMSGERARKEGRPVLARLVAWAGAARAPVEFTIAPADATGPGRPRGRPGPLVFRPRRPRGRRGLRVFGPARPERRPNRDRGGGRWRAVREARIPPATQDTPGQGAEAST